MPCWADYDHIYDYPTPKQMMKRFPLLTLAIVFIATSTQAQNFDWAGTISGQGSQIPNSVVVDDSGNIIIAGQFTDSTDLDPGPAQFVIAPILVGPPSFVSKLDGDGVFQWGLQFSGSGSMIVRDLAVDGSDNVLVAGDFYGTVDVDPGPASTYLTSTTSVTDAFVIKLDASGSLIWGFRLGGVVEDQAVSIAVDTLDNVIVLGNFGSTVDMDPDTATSNDLVSAGQSDMFISKFDSSGSFMWAGRVGGSALDRGYEISTDPTDHILVTGHFEATIDMDPGPAVVNLVSAGIYDGAIIKLDPTGGLVWAKQLAGPNTTISRTIAVNESGRIFVGGSFDGDMDSDPGLDTLLINTSSLVQGAFICALDQNGELQWSAHLAGGYQSVVLDLDADANGAVISTGIFSGTWDFDPSAGVDSIASFPGPLGVADIFLWKLGANGDLIFTYTFGGAQYDTGRAIDVTPSGDVLVTGDFSDTIDFDPGPAVLQLIGQDPVPWNADGFVLKLASPGQETAVGELEITTWLHPNPCNGVFNIEHDGRFAGATVWAFDFLGHPVATRYISSSSSLKVDMEAAPGPYLIQVAARDGDVARMVVLVQ